RLVVERDAEAPRVMLAHRAPQLLDAPAHRIAVVPRVERGLAELLDRDRRRGDVGIPEAEVDHVATLPPQLALQLVDRREDIGRQVVDAAKLHFQKYFMTGVGSTEPAERGRYGG